MSSIARRSALYALLPTLRTVARPIVRVLPSAWRWLVWYLRRVAETIGDWYFPPSPPPKKKRRRRQRQKPHRQPRAQPTRRARAPSAAPPAGLPSDDATRAQDGGEGVDHAAPSNNNSGEQGVEHAGLVAAGAPHRSNSARLGRRASDNADGDTLVGEAYTSAAAQERDVPAPDAKKEAPRGKNKDALLAGSKNLISAARGKNKNMPVARNQEVYPFEEDGYCLDILFREGLEVDEVITAYAVYCCMRSKVLDKQKNKELCDICYFKAKKVFSDKKDKILGHCWGVHKVEGYPCPKKGCYVRCSSLGDAGLHSLYVHEQNSKDWWKHFLEKRGMV